MLKRRMKIKSYLFNSVPVSHTVKNYFNNQHKIKPVGGHVNKKVVTLT